MDISQIEQTHLSLVRKLRKKVWQAQEDYALLEDGDLVLACLSGGKDSYTMLDMLTNIKKSGKIDFRIMAVNLDQKQPGFPEDVLPGYLTEYGIDFTILEQNTYATVTEKLKEGQTMCSLCSRLRRGAIYRFAKKIGATKVALGHHMEDVLETFMLNLMFSGKLEAMPPKYLTDDHQLTVIRPLVFCPEEMIATYAALRQFPIIPCNLCGSQPNLQRQMIKQLLGKWEKDRPGQKQTMLTSLKNVHTSHLFDKNAFDFSNMMEEFSAKSALVL